jgi:hypothetical protein
MKSNQIGFRILSAKISNIDTIPIDFLKLSNIKFDCSLKKTNLLEISVYDLRHTLILENLEFYQLNISQNEIVKLLYTDINTFY